MVETLLPYYAWIQAFHLVVVISWLAGMLYLPRLYVYHSTADKGSELSETLKIMERKLLRVIINPAMILVWVSGLTMIYLNPSLMQSGKWLHLKLTAVILLQGFHALLSRWRKTFLKDENRHTAKFYRWMNEVPTLLMVIIIIMVIVKPL